jgi:hypothetical protein
MLSPPRLRETPEPSGELGFCRTEFRGGRAHVLDSITHEWEPIGGSPCPLKGDHYE